MKPTRTSISKLITSACLLLPCAGLPNLALAEPDAATKQALAKASQNPVADLISLPLQDNVYFGVGPADQKQNVLNIQPVYPIELNSDWNLVTRTIIPVITQPDFGQGGGNTSGIGDIQFSEFLSPSNSRGWIWGVGTVVQAPTATQPHFMRCLKHACRIRQQRARMIECDGLHELFSRRPQRHPVRLHHRLVVQFISG